MKNIRSAIGTPSAIIAFETAGRYLNFTKAAEELNVSQPAISRQIRNLELHIGKPLFFRRGNKVRFTPQGRFLFEATNSSFQHIVSAIDQIRAHTAEEALVLRSQPIVLSTFVLPLLIDLQRTFPDVPIDIRSMDNEAPIDPDAPSISILYGIGNWPGMKAELIFDEIYFPICHPLILKGLKQKDPNDIFDRLPLLQISSFIDDWMDWHSWGAHFHIGTLSSKRPQLINDYEMLLRACRSGHGVAVGSLYLVAQSLQEGTLVRLTDLCVRSKFGFYLVYDQSLAQNKKHAGLLRWIRRKAEETRQSCLSILSDVQPADGTSFSAATK